MVYHTEFKTLKEAKAYEQGLRDAIYAINDDHLSVSPHINVELDNWVVRYQYND
jgi:hypothetical protein